MTKKRYSSIANQLRKAVRDTGQTGAELAKVSKVHEATLSRFHRKKVDPSLNSSERIAKACGYRMILIPWETK